MPLYFVDTWFFIAQVHERDPDHRFALRIGQALDDASFVTHDAVLTELLTFFAAEGSYWRKQVASLTRKVIASRRYRSIPMSRELLLEALDLYERRLDKEYSLVDCISMRIMRRLDITHVLSNDHHFAQEGFTLVSE